MSLPQTRDLAGADRLHGGGAIAPRARAAAPGAAVPPTVLNCYDLLTLSLLIGIEDYTDGMYRGDPTMPYALAQRNQHDYLLDQLGVGPGFRLLDVGCGSGSLMRRAEERGASATGITISPAQVDLGRARGLDVRLVNYRDLGAHFGAEFDGIVANGSIEHFCQPEDAARGEQDALYRQMFELFHATLRADSPARKVVTTVIHFRGAHVPARAVLRSPWLPPYERRAFRFGILHRGFGGYYPAPGQLARCAAPWFTPLVEQDGTEDYRLTSEAWLRMLRAALRKNAAFRRELARYFVRRPRHTTWFMLALVGPASWPWQFRGTVPPTVLYRHCWKARG